MPAENITKLEKRKQKLLEAIEITEKSKKQITEFAQNLASLYSSRKITREEYEGKLNKALKNRTAEQWLIYYNSYINHYKNQIDACEKQISSCRRKKAVLILTIFIILVLMAVLISLFFALKPNILEDIGEKISSVFQPSRISEVSIVLKDEEAVLSEEPLIQHQAVLEQPVKWEKNFMISKPTDFSLNLPTDSENIKLKKIENAEEKDIPSLSIETKLFTGEIEVKVEKDEGKYKVEYETPSPEISELEKGKAIKKVLIKGPDNVHYENILSFTELPREFDKNEIGKLKLYEIKNNRRIETKFTAYDTDENGLLDYIEWITPELSEAVFELVIEISKAEHLNENKEFISDIYEQVKALDGNWSEPIPAEHYVRVTFRQPLDNKRDITIYARASNYSNNSEECYDNETQILAENGWKYFYELGEGEKVMTLNSKTGKKEWQIPFERQEFEHDDEMYKIELEDGSNLLVSEEHKVYVGEERKNYNNLNSFINSSVMNILTSDCFLNESSSDQIGVLFNNKDKAKYGSSSTPSKCGDILLASERNLEYFALLGVLTDFFNKENKKSNSDSSTSENLIILPFLSDISFNTKSGEISSHPVFNNSSITYLLTESDLKNENKIDASTINDFGRVILTQSPCCLATFRFNSLESFEICSSVNLLLDNISLAIENSTLLTSCFNNLAKANSNSLLNSVGISILIQNSSSINRVNSESYKKLSVDDFKLQKVTETYQEINEGKELYFLDSENKSVKIKSIIKQPYNGKIYDVDVENDIVLVRRKNSSEIWSGNSNPQPAQIEVYRKDNNTLIAKFENITDESWHKIYLKNLSENESYDTFDLKIINGSVEIEYIVDPFITKIYYFTGDGSGTDELSMEQGTKTAVWSTGTDADWHYWILDAYSQDIVLTPQSPLVSFWCNNTGSIRGDKIQIDSINYFDCSDSSCTTMTNICSTRPLHLNCDVNGPAVNINSSACTISSNYTLVAGRYLAVGFMTSIGKEVRLNVYFNSSQYPSYFSMTEWAQDITPPDVNIISPLNQTYFQSSIDFNFTLNEAGYCEYSLDSGATNYTMTANSSNTGFNATKTSIADGSYIVNAYCNDTAGNKNYTSIATFNVSAASYQPPRITRVSEIPPISPVEASSTAVNFYATVYDPNGVGNLDDASVRASFIKEETARENGCVWLNDIDPNSANYSCAIDMWYWDEAGTWNVSIYAEDLNGNPAINETTTFQYNLLNAIVISPSELIWPELIPEAKNQTLDISTTINNTGNYNATGRIAVQAVNLYGETDNSEFIDAGNFTVDINPGETSCGGFSLINGTNITVSNSILETGNLSAGEAREQLYYCLKEVPLVSSQVYSTQQAGSWTVTVLIASVIIRKKKQKSKRLKNNFKKDNLLISLNLLSKELRQNYSEEKEKIVKLLIKEIKKRYRINSDELAELIETGEEGIPLASFSRELGALEAITKYMKENLGMSYHKIAILLNRDERTIWTAYHKSKKKQKEPIIVKEKDIFLPVSAFNKKLTILESVIVYLKERGRMYSEIAKLLNRDQRNIWLIYSRAIKK